MKRTIAALLILVGLSIALVFSARVWIQARAEYQQAIFEVLNRAHRARFQERRFTGGRVALLTPGEKGFSGRQYSAALRSIITSSCPMDFRTAWLEYLQARERSQDPLELIGPLAEFGVSIVSRSPGGVKDSLGRFDRLNVAEAWRRVEMVALKHGVQVTGR